MERHLVNHRRLVSVALDVSGGAVARTANLVFLVFNLSVALLGRIVGVVLLVRVRYVALLVNVGRVPSVSMMISPVPHCARRDEGVFRAKISMGCGNCLSWCTVR